MTETHSIRGKRAPILLTGLATLGITLAACGSAASVSQTLPPTVAPAATLIATPTPTTAVPAATPVPALAASEPQPIHLILRAVNDTLGSLEGCANAGTCQGDYMIGDDPLLDADERQAGRNLRLRVLPRRRG